MSAHQFGTLRFRKRAEKQSVKTEEDFKRQQMRAAQAGHCRRYGKKVTLPTISLKEIPDEGRSGA